MRIAYSKVQKRTFFHKSLVLKRLRVSPGSRSFLGRPLGFPLHMLTVITLEPIKGCPVALPSPKGSRSPPDPSPTSARSGIVVNAQISNPNFAASTLFSTMEWRCSKGPIWLSISAFGLAVADTTAIFLVTVFFYPCCEIFASTILAPLYLSARGHMSPPALP